MQYRPFGRTGVVVSRLALGTMSFGDEADEAEAAAIYAGARAAGINLFDCADVYSDGRAETMLGRLIAGERNDIVLATKAFFATGAGPNARGSSRYHLVRAVEASLARLATDRIDVLFLHRFDEVAALDETLRALEDLIRQGKILYPAVSNFAAWQAARALGIAERAGLSPIVAFQPMYNLAKRQAEVEILPLCRAEQLACLPYSPRGGGLLAGGYGSSRRPTRGRLVEVARYAMRYADPSYYALADRFAALAAELGVAPAALAIAWVGAHPAVTAPLLGARSRQQLDVALGAVAIDVTPELYDRIASLSPTPPPATDRDEERLTPVLR
jgi:aryl-alcohol dehydrogenase-like predicted oxidoreductase